MIPLMAVLLALFVAMFVYVGMLLSTNSSNFEELSDNLF